MTVGYFPDGVSAGRSAGSTGVVTVSGPTGLAVGDLELLIGEVPDGATLSITNNGGGSWTSLMTPPTVTGGEKLYVWWRIRQTGDGDPQVQASADHVCATRLKFNAGEFHPSVPFDENVTTGTDPNSTTSLDWTPTGYTTQGDFRTTVAIATIRRDSQSGSVNGPGITWGTGYVLSGYAFNAVDICTNQGSGGGFGIISSKEAIRSIEATHLTSTYSAASPKSMVIFGVRPNTTARNYSRIFFNYYRTTNATGYVTTSKSSAWPVGTLKTDAARKDMDDTGYGFAANASWLPHPSLAQAEHQDIYSMKFISRQLGGVTTIDANTWTASVRSYENSTNANAYYGFSLYVLKSDDTVRDYIYDTHAALGVEFGSSASTPQQFTFSGNQVTGIQPTDRLALEVWIHAIQDDAISHEDWVYVSWSQPDSLYIETPQKELFQQLLTPVTETDSARTLSFTQVGAQHKNITFATEKDSARPLLVPAREHDTAQTLDKDKHQTVSVATQSEAAQTLTYKKSITLGYATQPSSAQALDKDKHKSLSVTTSSSAAQTLNVDKIKSVGSAAESDSASTLTHYKSIIVSYSSESDLAHTLSFPITLISTAETDSAQTLNVVKPIYKAVATATETSSASTLKLPKLTAAVETNQAQAFAFTHGAISVTYTAENDSAQTLTVTKTIYKTLTALAESNASQSLDIDKTVNLYQYQEAPYLDTHLSIADDFNRPNEGPPPSTDWVNSVEGRALKVQNSQLVYAAGTDWGNSQYQHTITPPVAIIVTIKTAPTDYSFYFDLSADQGMSGFYGEGIEFGAEYNNLPIFRMHENETYVVVANQSVNWAANDRIAFIFDGANVIVWRKPYGEEWIKLVSKPIRVGGNWGSSLVGTPLYPAIWIQSTGGHAVDDFQFGSVPVWSEANTAQEIFKTKAISIAGATETESAQTLSITKTIYKTITSVTETDSSYALNVTKPILKTVTTAAETTSAQTFKIPKLTAATETYQAQGLIHSHGATVTYVTESDTAQALIVTKPIHKAISSAAETSAAQALSATKTILKSITAASETDVAHIVGQGITLDASTETGTAQSLIYGVPQIILPEIDSVDGDWTNSDNGTELFSYIDEKIPSDLDYIKSELSPVTSGTRIKLAGANSPQEGTRTLRARIAKDAAEGEQIDLTIKLYEGGGDTLGSGTLVHSFQEVDIDESFITIEDEVTEDINDYENLYIELEANKV